MNKRSLVRFTQVQTICQLYQSSTTQKTLDHCSVQSVTMRK